MVDAHFMNRRDALRLMTQGLAAASLGGLFAGCGPRLLGEPNLTLWHLWTGKQLAAHDSLLARFKATHPAARIESTHVPGDFLRARFIAALRSGLLPDLLAINSSWLRMPLAEKRLRNVSALAKADELRLPQRLIPRDYERCLIGDALLALPLSSSAGGSMLFSNSHMLAAAGLSPRPKLRTWSEFTAFSSTLVGKLNPDRSTLRCVAWDPFSYNSVQMLVALALGAGSPMISRDGHTSLIKDPGFERVMEALDHHIQTVYGPFGGYRALLQWRVQTGELAITAPNSAFRDGTQAFCMSGAWFAGELINATPRPSFEVSAIPGLDSPHGGIAAHGWAVAMRASPADPELAWALMKYLTVDAEGNGRLCVEAQRPCPIRSVNESDAYSGMGDVWDSIRQTMSLDIPYPYSVDSDFLRILGYEFPLRRLRGESIKDIIENYHRRLQAYLDGLAKEGSS